MLRPLRKHLPILAWAGILFIFAPARAQISPGELSRYHAKLEGIANCTACHELRKEVSNNNCLACHTALRRRIQEGSGYHASAEVKGRNCRECHSEHNGRDFEPVHWKESREKFDHKLTGFELTGAHARQDCRVCHKAAFMSREIFVQDSTVNRERTYLGLNTACISCHVDEHRDQLTDDCASCHNTEKWSPAPKFTHDKTRYPLTGRHAQVECVKCHVFQPAPPVANEALIEKKDHPGTFAHYTGLSFASCTDCHQDVHRGKFGLNCAECHTTAGFHEIVGEKFDHSRTAFPLKGKHARVDCAKCHTSGKMTDPVAHAQCKDCHRDAHHGQFAKRKSGGACEECHTEDGFIPCKFDLALHDSTRYPLTGSHLAVPCFLCHAQTVIAKDTTARFQFADLTCKGCHADVHQGQLDVWINKSGCEFCHTTETWHRTTFDHKLARFPLQGKHNDVACRKCHEIAQPETGKKVLWMKPLPTDCKGCHDDAHQGQFVRVERGETDTKCERCHTPEGWPNLLFVHNRDARFALDGAHENVACAKCHSAAQAASGKTYIVYRPLGMTCNDCHGSGVKSGGKP